jgi:putative flippase GtrA
MTALDTDSGLDTGTHNFIRRLAGRLPRPLRFLGVGAVGLAVDLSVFTAVPFHLDHPLAVRILSLAAATVVTWRLNRALTFDATGRRPRAEALRYVLVTAVAQGTSYTVFAALVLTMLGALPQIATILGAAIAAGVSYAGHRLYAFAPLITTPSAQTGVSDA